MEAINLIEVSLNGTRVGRLAQTNQHLCAFEYDTAFLQHGFALSPYFLPLRPGLIVAKATPFGGNFGVFEDSLPDGWGSLLLSYYLRLRGLQPAQLTVLQRLALVGASGRGALEYHPDHGVMNERGELPDFDLLAAEVDNMLNIRDVDEEHVETLFQLGGSSGGARPKVFAEIEGKEWLVKFRASVDPPDVGVVEYEHSLLAKACGIEMPETRLFKNKYFGVRRFDRDTSGRKHTISAAGLLHADYRIPSLDYSTLLKVTLHLTKNMEEVYAMFRRMVFNVAISNRDDHARNFSFQYHDGQWKLSPAYDLLPSTGFNGFHTTTINNNGNPTLSDIQTAGLSIGIPRRKIDEITEMVLETCKRERMLRWGV